MIQKCVCDHEGQDLIHGDKMRVHNETKLGEWRCTVCGKVKSESKSTPKKSEKEGTKKDKKGKEK